MRRAVLALALALASCGDDAPVPPDASKPGRDAGDACDPAACPRAEPDCCQSSSRSSQ